MLTELLCGCYEPKVSMNLGLHKPEISGALFTTQSWRVWVPAPSRRTCQSHPMGLGAHSWGPHRLPAIPPGGGASQGPASLNMAGLPENTRQHQLEVDRLPRVGRGRAGTRWWKEGEDALGRGLEQPGKPLYLRAQPLLPQH